MEMYLGNNLQNHLNVLCKIGRKRRYTLKLDDDDGIALLEWFENMELLKLSKLTYNTVVTREIKTLEEKAKEYDCAAVHVFKLDQIEASILHGVR